MDFFEDMFYYEGWDREVGRAFALGQVLGNVCDEQKNVNNSSISNSLEKTKNCVMLKFELYEVLEKLADIKVDIKSLQSAISANLEWKDLDRQTFSPFEELYDLKEIQNPAN